MTGTVRVSMLTWQRARRFRRISDPCKNSGYSRICEEVSQSCCKKVDSGCSRLCVSGILSSRCY